MKNRIGIFVPVYFRENLVIPALNSLVKSCENSSLPVSIHIIDNNSNESLKQYLRSLNSNKVEITKDFMDSNIGKAKAINLLTNKYPDFSWFINFDSDIVCSDVNWIDKLHSACLVIENAGMISVNYANNGNNPMPKQPKEERLSNTPYGDMTLCWGGAVAGGCFMSSEALWRRLMYAENNFGVYGGIDGFYRLRMNSIGKKCGYISEIVLEHPVDTDVAYANWKTGVHNNLRQKGFNADKELIGNKRGFYD